MNEMHDLEIVLNLQRRVHKVPSHHRYLRHLEKLSIGDVDADEEVRHV